MTTAFIGKGYLAADRLHVDETNGTGIELSKMVSFDGKSVAILVNGPTQDFSSMVEVFMHIESMWIKSGTGESIEKEIDALKIYQECRIWGLVRMTDTWYQSFEYNSKTGELEILGDEIVRGYGTGASLVMSKYHHMNANNEFDIKEIMRFALTRDCASSQSFNSVHWSDLTPMDQIEKGEKA